MAAIYGNNLIQPLILQPRKLSLKVVNYLSTVEGAEISWPHPKFYDKWKARTDRDGNIGAVFYHSGLQTIFME